MRPSVLLVAVILSAAADASAHGRPKAPPKVPRDQVQQYTDAEFQVVESIAGERKSAVTKAQGNFNKMVLGSKTETFEGVDVDRVGPAVAGLINAYSKYYQAIRNAHTAEEVEHAGNEAKAEISHTGLSLPMMTFAKETITAQSQDAKKVLANGGSENLADASIGPANAVKTGLLAPIFPKPKGGHRGESELIVMAMKATRDALAQEPKPNPPNGGNSPAPGGGVTPNPGGGQNPSSGGGAIQAPTIGELIGIHDPSSPADAMSNARERYANGDVSGAIGDASRAIQLGGGADAYAMRGGMLFDQQQYGAANADARQALQADPRNAEARTLLQFTEGRVEGGGGGGGSAGGSAGASGASGGRAAYGGFVGKESSAAPTEAQRAAAARLSGEQAQRAAQNALALRDFSAAMAYADRALASNPNDPGMLNIRATAYARRREYAKGLADAKAAWALAPRNGTILKTKGFLEVRAGQYKDALGSANMLIESNPKDAYGYALRAQAEAHLGDLEGYRADIARAGELDPSFAKNAPANLAQAPSDSDLVFLFPGEEGPRPAAAAPSRARNFSWIVGASIVGGLLLAFGLLQTVLAPLKEQVSSVFTRITRTGPTVGALAEEPGARGPAPGLIRGQYEITRPIGAGGMGMVYEGTDRSLGRRVAIKKMRDELRADPRERARFVSEAKTVAALHHPNIVDIYSIADEGDDVYLIFEYVDGKTVHDLVQASGRLAPDQAAAIVDASAGALEFAHARGVIHRDMKPSNVMVDASGRVKVMDFGIARMAKEAMTRYSMTNTVVGTPPYMAPEQEQGQVRRESDVYSLAVCAYEMLTGRLPFQGIGGGMSLNKINMAFVPPSRETPGLPPALDEVFARAFQADPEKRYRAPGEFAAALRSVLPAAARA